MLRAQKKRPAVHIPIEFALASQHQRRFDLVCGIVRLADDQMNLLGNIYTLVEVIASTRLT